MKSQTQNAQLSFKPITRSMHNNNNGDDNDGVKKIICMRYSLGTVFLGSL